MIFGRLRFLFLFLLFFGLFDIFVSISFGVGKDIYQFGMDVCFVLVVRSVFETFARILWSISQEYFVQQACICTFFFTYQKNKAAILFGGSY